MPRLTFNRKDMAGQSIGIATAMTGISSADSTSDALKALAVWRYRGLRPQHDAGPAPAPEGGRRFFDGFSGGEAAMCPGAGSRNRGHIAS
jgi:hypothetical protein